MPQNRFGLQCNLWFRYVLCGWMCCFFQTDSGWCVFSFSNSADSYYCIPNQLTRFQVFSASDFSEFPKILRGNRSKNLKILLLAKQIIKLGELLKKRARQYGSGGCGSSPMTLLDSSFASWLLAGLVRQAVLSALAGWRVGWAG